MKRALSACVWVHTVKRSRPPDVVWASDQVCWDAFTPVIRRQIRYVRFHPQLLSHVIIKKLQDGFMLGARNHPYTAVCLFFWQISYEEESWVYFLEELPVTRLFAQLSAVCVSACCFKESLMSGLGAGCCQLLTLLCERVGCSFPSSKIKSFTLGGISVLYRCLLHLCVFVLLSVAPPTSSPWWDFTLLW